MSRWIGAALLGLLVSIVTGCESGREVAGVQAATASREADDRVSVSVVLSCHLVYGVASAVGCDANGERVCVSAHWYAATDTLFASAVAAAELCQVLPKIHGMQVELSSSEAIPRDPGSKILVRADPRGPALILPNP